VRTWPWKLSKVVGAASAAALLAVGQAAWAGAPGRTHRQAGTIHLVVGQWSSSPAEHQLVLNQVAAFHRLHPNIDVSVRVITGNYLEALQPMLASHTAPDVFYVDSSYAQQLESAGVILPLDAYIRQDHVNLSDYLPNLLAAFTWKGHIYGLPKDFNTLALESNPALLAKAGISSPPSTWEQFETDAAKLKAKGIVPMCFPIDVARYYPFILDEGGSYYNPKTGAVTFNIKQNYAGLNWFLQNNEKGYFVAPNVQGASWCGEPFAQGKVAMTAEGAWILPFLAQTAPKMKYVITPFPSLNGKDANMVYTVAYEVAKSTKYPQQAAQLAFFLTGPQALAMTAKTGLAIPSRKSVEGLFLHYWPSQKAFLEGVRHAYPYEFGVSGASFVTAINNATQAGVLKKESPATVLASAQQSFTSQNY
jgi:multiple sugar transport system substrate-binding protein